MSCSGPWACPERWDIEFQVLVRMRGVHCVSGELDSAVRDSVTKHVTASQSLHQMGDRELNVANPWYATEKRSQIDIDTFTPYALSVDRSYERESTKLSQQH